MAGRGAAASQAAASSTKPAASGPGTKMLEEMRKKGKPIDPKMEQMAAWLDKLNAETGDMGGEVCSVQGSNRHLLRAQKVST